MGTPDRSPNSKLPANFTHNKPDPDLSKHLDSLSNRTHETRENFLKFIGMDFGNDFGNSEKRKHESEKQSSTAVLSA